MKRKTALYALAALITLGLMFTACEQPTSHTSPNSPVKPRGMTLAEATDAIKAIPATFDASKDEPLQIVFAGDMTYTEAEGNAFYNAMKAAPDASVAIDMEQADMTEIPDYMFNGCKSLASIIFPRSVTSIGEYAFAQTLFTEIVIPNSVTDIGNLAFYSCYSLTSVNIGNGVTSIGDGAFSHCKSLTSVNIPDNVTSIGGAAFSTCESLTSVTIKASIPPELKSAYGYYNNFSSTVNAIYVPTGSVDSYKNAESWKAAGYTEKIKPLA